MYPQNNILESMELLVEANRLQGKVIDHLFMLLAQHISTEEAGRLSCLADIKRSAEIMDQFQ